MRGNINRTRVYEILDHLKDGGSMASYARKVGIGICSIRQYMWTRLCDGCNHYQEYPTKGGLCDECLKKSKEEVRRIRDAAMAKREQAYQRRVSGTLV